MLYTLLFILSSKVLNHLGNILSQCVSFSIYGLSYVFSSATALRKKKKTKKLSQHILMFNVKLADRLFAFL